MAESRGGREDRRLKDAFRQIFEDGTDYFKPHDFAIRLTSRQLKVKPKPANIAGLQLADIIAHPSFKATLARHKGEALPDNYGGSIAELLEQEKYYRSPEGKIDGWGRLWLP